MANVNDDNNIIDRMDRLNKKNKKLEKLAKIKIYLYQNIKLH